MRFHSRGRLLVGLSALAFGLLGCTGSPETSTSPSGDSDEVTKVAEGLGDPVTGCSNGPTGFAAGTLTIATFSGTVVLSAPGGVLKMNGQTCLDGSGAALLVTGTGTTAVKKIIMADSGGAGPNQVMVDLYAGNLTTVFAGGVTNGLQVTLTATTNSFLLRTTNAVDKINMGVATDLFFDIGVGGTAPDGKADVRVIGANAAKISLASGNDVFAPVTSGISSGFSGTSVALTTAVPTIPMTIYGGDGDDVITDGSGNDSVFGGAGNDTIKASNIGTDVFYGGVGTDMIDYGTRSLDITASLLTTTGTLAFSGQPANGDSVTIGSTTYTFKTALSGTPTGKEVLIGADAAASRTALVKAIMISGVDGTDYKCAATCIADPLVSAVANGANLVVTALVSSGPAVGLTKTGANIAWGATSLFQQVAVATADTDKLYEFENITTGSGNDTITGSETANLIYGGTGNDILYGGAGADTIYGGAGNDNIYGGPGITIDNLFGDDGNDTFYADTATAGDGVDVITGGAGTDTVTYYLRTPAASPTISVAVTIGTAGSEENIKNDVEALIGTDGDDTLAFAATITGTLSIDGKNGINSITGSLAASNTLTGGAGVDTITGGNLADFIYADASADIIDAKGGADYIEGGAGDDTITCGSGDDLVYGEAGNDTITGDDGNDIISGGDGDDILTGGNGDDQIAGGIGDDQITGNAGADVLTGNAGTNHFKSVAAGGDMVAGDVCMTAEGTNDIVDNNTCEVF